ncbi:uncharacterized protein [Ptychodera flava]|uniref:uncharacterized protein n=1 Tax=Ptychodera flava TaxID=63121 RepID=UPI003969E9BA
MEVEAFPTQSGGTAPGAATAQPPSYSEVSGKYAAPGHESPFVLAYVDFIPACLQQMGFGKEVIFERFDAVMAKANQWLLSNPNVEVMNCESLEKKVEGYGTVDPSVSTRVESGKIGQYMVRVLRLWYCPRRYPGGPDQLGYINCVPACLKGGGWTHYPEFENLGVTLTNLNTFLQEKPIQGRIVTAETQEIKVYGGWKTAGVDPDQGCWHESGDLQKLLLFIIRIFYVIGQPHYEQIDIVDFVPTVQLPGGAFGKPTAEPFAQVMSRTRNWIQQTPNIRVTNIQTVNVKLRKDSFTGPVVIDTQRMSFSEGGAGGTCFVRTLRVVSVRSNVPLPPTPPLNLTYRTFVPCRTTTGGAFNMPKFEDHQQTLVRIMAWLQASGAQVVGAETFEMTMFYSGGYMVDEEATIHYDSGMTDYFLTAMRVYINGTYEEPPAELLPTLPEVSNDDCCKNCQIL